VSTLSTPSCPPQLPREYPEYPVSTLSTPSCPPQLPREYPEYPVSTLSTPSCPPQLPRFPLERDDRARACRRGARRTARPAAARGAANAAGAGGLGGAGRVFVCDRVALVPVWSADPHSDRMRVGGVRCRIASHRIASHRVASRRVSVRCRPLALVRRAIRFDSAAATTTAPQRG
jgi:hypothetical protein